MRVAFFLILISTAAAGQKKCCFSSNIRDSIHFANPSYNFHVARSGTNYSGTITVPSNYTTPSWQIIDHGTRSVYSSGTSYSVNYTFTYGTGRNVYDLRVVATSPSGFATIERLYAAEFTCLPALFTEGTADRVYDLSTTGMGFHDDSWTDHSAGYKIWVKNSNLSSPNYFYLDDFKSSVDDKPVHIIFDNVTMYSTASGNFYLGPTQNVIIDGAKDEATYGINLVRNTGGTQDQNFTWYVTGNNGHDHPSYRTVICGISTTNVDHTTGGSAGIQISPNNTATYNRDTYVNDQILLFHCRTNWTSGEGVYINHFDDALHGGFAYSGSSNAWFYDNIIYNAANEAWQIGSCFGCEVFRNRWINSGVGNGVGQRNILQWSDGNRDLVTYQNYGDTSHDIWSSFTGLRGKNMEAFSNVFYSTGPSASDGVNVFIKQKQSDTYASEYWGIYNNDFVMAGISGTGIPFSLYNDTGSPTTLFDSLVLADNIVVTNTATTYTTSGGFDITNLYVNNYQVTNSALPLFVNFAGKNLDLSSTSSPAFRSLSTFVKRHWASAYDCQGYAFLVGHPVVGAYSGAKLFTH